MSIGLPVYGKGRFPKLRKDENGKTLCRGCGGPITDTRRKTWCSHSCHEKFDPMYVRLQVISRDKNICQVCKINIKEARKEWRSRQPAFSFTDNGEYSKWRKEEPKEEYHHVVEFAEGGLTTPENMITICRQCHRKVTAEFARNRAMKKKEGGVK